MEVPHSSNSNKKRKDKRESFWNKEYFYADIWFDAARDGNLATIQHYLDGGWDVNMQDLRWWLGMLEFVRNMSSG